MHDLVYLNGELVPASMAKISVFDHGFLYGDGIFDTMRSYNGSIFLLDDHLDRLFAAAEAIRLKMPWSREDISAALGQIIETNGSDLYIRLTVSRGPGPVGIDPELCPQPTLVIASKPITISEALYTQGATAIFVKTVRNLKGSTPPEIKSLNFLNNIIAKQEVIQAGAHEGFMLNQAGQVTEGTVSNVFLVKKGRVLTPPAEAGILLGVTRKAVISICSELNIDCSEQLLNKLDFTDAEEVFYTNSGSEIVPVTTLDGKAIVSGTPGPITLKILKHYRYLTVQRQG